LEVLSGHFSGRSERIRKASFEAEILIHLFVCFWRDSPPVGPGLLIHEVSWSHPTTHHSWLDSSGRVISSSQRPLPDNTQHSQQTHILALGGIRTHNLSRRAAADLRIRPRGNWDRPQTHSNGNYYLKEMLRFFVFDIMPLPTIWCSNSLCLIITDTKNFLLYFLRPFLKFSLFVGFRLRKTIFKLTIQTFNIRSTSTYINFLASVHPLCTIFLSFWMCRIQFIHVSVAQCTFWMQVSCIKTLLVFNNLCFPRCA
jgi:hypothetical protein